jgi:N-acyl-D-amino-acid deacylase
MKTLLIFFLLLGFISGCTGRRYDIIIRNGIIFDGSGEESFTGDVAINADTIALVSPKIEGKGRTEIDASGLAVSPGFINMLSWANESLIEDGRSQSDIRQGVTLEILGEGDSMGPLNEKMKKALWESQGDIKYEILWTTLDEYLCFLERNGVSTNIASFVGATTLRIYTVGYENRPPDAGELDTMKILLRQAMEDGAVGLSSAIQYVPASFAGIDELTALCRETASYDGLYISHIRDEGDRLIPSIDEFLETASRSGVRAEIYHLKQSGKSSWGLLDKAIRKIDSARAAGLKISADMYNYIASSTGFDIIMPDWVQEGGFDAWKKRLMDPATRERIIPDINRAMTQRTGTAENVLLIGFDTDSLKYLTGKTLAEVSAMRGKSPEETAMDLIIQDDSRIGVVYFSMSEENVRKQIALPWMTFGSDGGSYSNEGVFLKFSTHPRAYGNFARLLGRYVRDEKVIALEEAVHRLTLLPASNLKLSRRGALRQGYYADIAIFDPGRIIDNATFEAPHQYATGMVHVLVNGVPVLKDGEHTGAMPGRVVRGPGWIKK